MVIIKCSSCIGFYFRSSYGCKRWSSNYHIHSNKWCRLCIKRISRHQCQCSAYANHYCFGCNNILCRWFSYLNCKCRFNLPMVKWCTNTSHYSFCNRILLCSGNKRRGLFSNFGCYGGYHECFANGCGYHRRNKRLYWFNNNI